MKTTRMRTALLGSGAAVALVAAAGPASADDIDALKAQIEALQDKVSQLESKQATPATSNVAPAAAVEAGDKPKSWILPGTNTSMNIGGYAKLDFIYDINSFAGDSNNQAPVAEGSTAGNQQGNARLHAKQSRVWFKTWTPTDWGELATHIEGDFEGAGGNEFVSNSTSLRLRHAYGRLGPVLAGQTWTNFMGIEHLPETIDFAGPAGESFLRQGQIRYTHSFGGGTALALSVENPESFVVTAGSPIAANTGPDTFPDFVAALTHRWSTGSVRLSGVARNIEVDNGGGGAAVGASSDALFGWGVHASGTWQFLPTTNVSAGFNYLDGAGRYMLPLLIDAVLTTPTNLEAVESWGAWASVGHKWTDTIRSTVVVGRAESKIEDAVVGGKAGVPVGTVDIATTVAANLIWSPVPQVNFGIEYIWGQAQRHNSNNGRTSRVQVGMQYQF